MNQYAQLIWLTSACIVLLESFLSCIVFGFGLNETFPHDHWINYQKCRLTEPPHGSSLTFDLSQLLVSGMSKIPEPAHQQVQISLIDGNVKCGEKKKNTALVYGMDWTAVIITNIQISINLLRSMSSS